jgi:neutral ceramidase
MSNLSGAVAVGDITPQPGVSMGGYWARPSVAKAVNDRLHARAAVWSDGLNRAALVVLDLIALHTDRVEVLRHRITESSGIPPEAILICCTHTHSGPLTYPYRGMGTIDAEYMAALEDRVVESVQSACARLEAVTLSYARVPFHLGRNRRDVTGENPKAPLVSHLHVIRMEGASGPIASIFSHPCHPVVLGADNCAISADFPGAAVRYVEHQSGIPAIFVNGACGDVNPRITNGTFDDARKFGALLGQAVEAGLATSVPVPVDRVASSRQILRLGLLPPPGRLYCEATNGISWLKGIYRRCSPGTGNRSRHLVAQANLEWIRETKQWRRQGAPSRSRRFEIQGIRLGDLAFLGFEGELFARYQLDIEEESPFQPTIVCGLANGCVGYLPTSDEYSRGGYEIEEAYKVYGEMQMFGPESEQAIRSGARQVLEVLKETNQ